MIAWYTAVFYMLLKTFFILRSPSKGLARSFIRSSTLLFTPNRNCFLDAQSRWSQNSDFRQSSRLFQTSVGKNSILTTRSKIKNILSADHNQLVGEVIKICGWVRTLRSQKKNTFIEVNDGSCLRGLQAVVEETSQILDDTLKQLSTGCSVEIIGSISLSEGKGQKYDLKVMSLRIIGESPESYPLQKKRHSLEYLRTIAHLRPRTNTFGAVARVRSSLAQAAHDFFQREGFLYLQSPIITSSDCEGAGEMFRVTTLPVLNPSKGSSGVEMSSIRKEGSESNETDFFGKPSFLTVSGQLSAEAFACSVGDVYTFGPTFRAEKSQTTRHLAEFNMIEPELAFADMSTAMNNAEAFLKYVTQIILSSCAEDLSFFESFYNKALMQRLTDITTKPFTRIHYKEAVSLLQKEISKDPSKWSYPNVTFGTDLQTEHERWLSEVHCKGCVFVHNYPRAIKSFYMHDNDDNETVDSFDLLVPGIGELIGGSQRENRLHVLENKLEYFKLSKAEYEWYLDLRRYLLNVLDFTFYHFSLMII